MLAAAGCKGPIELRTHSQVKMDSPLLVQASTRQTPATEAGPVIEMPIAPGGQAGAGGKIALIDVDSLLVNTNLTGPYSQGENPVALFAEKLAAAAADPHVGALVVRINSPGGGVTASDIMWHQLQEFRARTGIPVVACLMDLGTGGAYYLATASDQIVANPAAITGGIGVILNLYNLRDTMAQFNVLGQPIKAGKHIDMGSAKVALSDETRAMLQAIADQFHQRFRHAVLQRRPQVNAADPTNFDGRIFTAEEAKNRGLLDQIGYLDDAIEAARKLARGPCPYVVMYRRGSDPAHGIYATTPNQPLQATFWPVSIPGIDRSRLPSFLYMWQPEPTLERLGGK